MLEINKIYNGDCLEVMKQIDDKSIDLTITSPPYDNLRTYNNLEWNFDIFKNIAKELFRVTKDGGIIVWVVGDETKNFCESLSSFKQILYFVDECKFNLLDTMIYYKQNYAPAYPNLKRYANQFEYMFILSKGKPKTFNPIKIKKKEHRNGICGFRKKNGDVVKKIVISNNEFKQASNVWQYAVGFKNLGHPAVFPEKLAKDHILSWSNEGDIVLDPMCGSGTTCKMSLLNNRKFIGIEKDKNYFKIANERIKLCEV